MAFCSSTLSKSYSTNLKNTKYDRMSIVYPIITIFKTLQDVGYISRVPSFFLFNKALSVVKSWLTYIAKTLGEIERGKHTLSP